MLRNLVIRTRRRLATMTHPPADRPVTREDIDYFYRDVLGREPDPGGYAHHLESVQAKAMRRDIFKKFLNSEEFKQHRMDGEGSAFVAEYERDYGRSPFDPGGLRWFHSHEFPDGQIADGNRPREVLLAEAELVFKYPVTGKSVLDIGAWDGFFSFEAEKRGASRVLSTDHFSWSGPGWGTKDGYDYAHRAFGSRCESLDIDVFALAPAIQGRFDVVLFLGVLYHLKDPLGGLERAAAMCSDHLIVETVTACADLDYPVMRFFPGASMDGDDTNFYAPNVPCLKAMLGDLGFSKTEAIPHPTIGGADSSGMGRHTVHAWR